MPELITTREALARVGLGDLMSESAPYANTLVAWEGYPRPFACGHTAVYGFGPLDRPEDNDQSGRGRRYQDTVRVNQYHCGGEVLFSWCCWSRSLSDRPYQTAMNMVVSVREVPDRHSTCLAVGFTG
jgi:hypothetical protein